jgi:hypothetical protein
VRRKGWGNQLVVEERMDAREENDGGQLEAIATAFREQLIACLEECARGRRGLFSSLSAQELAEGELEWPEAARLRELAAALQSILNQREEKSALADEFLDLCTIHGESDPGERRLARAFLERIEKGLVGTDPQAETRPW